VSTHQATTGLASQQQLHIANTTSKLNNLDATITQQTHTQTHHQSQLMDQMTSLSNVLQHVQNTSATSVELTSHQAILQQIQQSISVSHRTISNNVQNDFTQILSLLQGVSQKCFTPDDDRSLEHSFHRLLAYALPSQRSQPVYLKSDSQVVIKELENIVEIMSRGEVLQSYPAITNQNRKRANDEMDPEESLSKKVKTLVQNTDTVALSTKSTPLSRSSFPS